MGRPPIGDKAMTAAERARRYRERHGLGGPRPSKAELEAENAELRRRLAELTQKEG